MATPAMAGIVALINQNAGTPQGSPNAQLYALAAKQTYSSCRCGERQRQRHPLLLQRHRPVHEHFPTLRCHRPHR